MAKARKVLYRASAAKRRKHCPDGRTRAIVVFDGEKRVGKCSASLTDAEAQALLEAGIGYAGRSSRSPHPEKVFNVWKGIPYRAQHGGRGEYHGFPVHPEELENVPDIRDQLRERARQAGDVDEFDDWLAGGWAGGEV